MTPPCRTKQFALLFWAALWFAPHLILASRAVDAHARGARSATWIKTGEHLDRHIPHSVLTPRHIGQDAVPLRVRSATQAEINAARALLQSALTEASVRNHERVRRPARNTYHASELVLQSRDGRSSSFTQDLLAPAPPLLEVSADVASAAALLAELGSTATAKRGTDGAPKNSSFWMENIARKGLASSNYEVFRNVRDFGAKGDGLHDDTAAIRRAILAASSKNIDANARCADQCDGLTMNKAVVYFPSGTYLVSGTVPVLPGTQVIGDATSPPILKAAPSFVGLGVISTEKDGGQAPNDPDSSFWQIRNLIVDITSAAQHAYISAIHYRTSHAASLSFVEIRATSRKENPATTQMGVFSENGNGGQISDLTVVGGQVGFYGGTSQFTAQRISFHDCGAAVQLLWDWAWIWKSITVADCDIGFQLHSNDTDSKGREISRYLGSIHIMDSDFTNVGTAIKNAPYSLEPGKQTTGITLDNVAFTGSVNHRVWDGEREYVEGSPISLDTWVLGSLYLMPPEKDVSLGYEFETRREQSLLEAGADQARILPKYKYFEKPKPQYMDIPADRWVHTKDFCAADGQTDDTACFQRALDEGGHLFVDAGVYLLSDTVTVRPGSYIVGEAWPQLMASGPKFSDPDSPRPVVRVGQKGDVGLVEIQDLVFTTKGATGGAVMVEWQVKGDESGKAGMWDSHVLIGDAIGPQLASKECLAEGETCHEATMLMHITPGASAYLENVWLSVIGGQTNGFSPTRLAHNSAYAARGMLVESDEPTWLYGTSVEHAGHYQYNFHKSKRVFAAMIQTESPASHDSRRSAAIKVFPGDPECLVSGKDCVESPGVIIQGTEDISIAGAALYSWYKDNSTNCISDRSCQDTMVAATDNKNLSLQNIITVGARNSIISDNSPVPSSDNLAIDAHPNWSQITTFAPIHNAADSLACRDDGAWSAQPPNGKYRDPIINDNRRFFVSMVNGSPYRWTNTFKSSYQMSEFAYASVDVGFSPQVSMKYGPGNFVDCNGEAGFQMDGTNNRFELRGTTNDRDATHKMRAQYIFDFAVNGVQQGTAYEWRSRGSERAVNFVLTGSEKVGYWSSVNPPVAWMNELLPIIGGRKLRHISMLGSHNAGISYRNGGTIGPEAASICQGVNILGQLQAGSRWFDIRPVIGNGGQLLTGHYSGQTAPVLGINGQPLADIVDNINAFTASNPELIVLSLTHAMQTDAGYRNLNDAEWNRVFDEMERLTHRCPDLQGQIPDMTLDSLIGSRRACVIVLSDGGPVRPNQGIYSPRASFDFIERWSNVDKAADMAADQTSWTRANRNLVADAGQRRDRFAISQWILTVKDLAVLFASIEDYALNRAYDPLFWRAFSAYTPWSFPSVVLMDFVGIINQGDKRLLDESGEARAFVMAVNVGLASVNCWIGEGSV